MGSLFEIFVERYSWLILEEDIISNFSIAYCIHLWLVCLFQGCIYLMGALLMQATYLLFQILNDFSSCLIIHIICIQYRWVIGSRSAWAMYNLFSYQKTKNKNAQYRWITSMPEIVNIWPPISMWCCYHHHTHL